MGFKDYFPAIAGAVGGLGNAIGSNITANKQIKAQREENEATRRYNMMLAEKQNKWSVEQWERNNDYNSPTAQMARYRDAGLNADLMYGQGTSGNSNAPAPMTSGASGMPTDLSPMARKMTLGQATQTMLSDSLAAAQLSNITADTAKKEADTGNTNVQTKLASVDLITRAAQNQSALQLTNSSVTLNRSIAELNDKQLGLVSSQINYFDASAGKLQKECGLLDAQLKNVDADTQAKYFDMYMRSKQFELLASSTYAQIRKIDSDIEVNEATIQETLGLLLYKKLNLAADTFDKQKSAHLKSEQRVTEYLRQLGMDVDRNQATFNLESDKSYRNAERVIEMGTKILDSVSNAAESIMSIISKGKGGKIGFK